MEHVRANYFCDLSGSLEKLLLDWLVIETENECPIPLQRITVSLTFTR